MLLMNDCYRRFSIELIVRCFASQSTVPSGKPSPFR